MPQLTPSKQKMIIAKQFMKKLHKLAGLDLKSVFVAGSVAADLAVPKSDIDLVVVCEDIAAVSKSCSLVSHELSSRTREQFVVELLSTSEFVFQGIHNLRRPRPQFATKWLLGGAVPIFGKEYAYQHKDRWQYPSLELAREKYGWQSKAIKPEERLRFKRGKNRFLRP